MPESGVSTTFTTENVVVTYDKPVLHAFPEGSDIALCGRKKAHGAVPVTAGTRCQACEAQASQKWFLGR